MNRDDRASYDDAPDKQSQLGRTVCEQVRPKERRPQGWRSQHADQHPTDRPPRAEITRDVKKGLTGSVFFIAALVVLFYSTFFFFFFLAELLDTWLWRWAAFLIVFGIMVVVTGALALFGFLKVRRIRGPQQTIESVKETRSALTPGHDKPSAPALNSGGTPTDPSGW
jgi:cytochrome c biogenesis protein CcdA